MDENINITKATDMIMDNLRLPRYLYKTVKKNTNGMNLMNSSPNTENRNPIELHTLKVAASTVPPLTIPNWANTGPIADEYIIYAAKRTTIRRRSLRDGNLTIAL